MRGDGEAFAGDDPDGGVGGEGDELVADGVPASGCDLDVVAVEAAESVPVVAGEAVEVGDVGAPPREQGAVVTVGDVVGPGFGHRGEGFDSVGSGVDATVSSRTSRSPRRRTRREVRRARSRSAGSCCLTLWSRVTVSSGWRSMSAASAPPGPTAASWWWSPTSTRLAWACWTASARRARLASSAMPVSSTMTTVRESRVSWPWSSRHSSDAKVRGVEVRFGGEGAGGLPAGRGAQHPVAGPVEDGGDGVERGGLAGTGDADHHADRGAAPADLLDDLALPGGERTTEALLALVDRGGDLSRVDAWARVGSASVSTTPAMVASAARTSTVV